MSKVTIEQAVAWIDEEIMRLKRAPDMNGCSMTPEWQEQLEIMELARTALTEKSQLIHCGTCTHRWQLGKDLFCDNWGRDWPKVQVDGFCNNGEREVEND